MGPVANTVKNLGNKVGRVGDKISKSSMSNLSLSSKTCPILSECTNIS